LRRRLFLQLIIIFVIVFLELFVQQFQRTPAVFGRLG
jgi:hypothetical protein